MTKLFLTKEGKKITDQSSIKKFLQEKGILYERWDTQIEFSKDATQEEILSAYEHKLIPFMEENDFQSADVINIHKETPGIAEIRVKFLKEHTHSEDEVRFFVDGEGIFWFHISEEVFSLHLKAGDFISVPKGFKHWFDLAPAYFVKVIRIFSNVEGWIADYTESKIEEKYVV